jgi:hypothetical protein
MDKITEVDRFDDVVVNATIEIPDDDQLENHRHHQNDAEHRDFAAPDGRFSCDKASAIISRCHTPPALRLPEVGCRRRKSASCSIGPGAA